MDTAFRPYRSGGFEIFRKEALEIDGLGRFRVNVFLQRGTVAAVLRVIPYEIRTFRELGLPAEDLPSPMIPLVVGDTPAMRRLHDALRGDGVLVPYLPRYAGLGPDGALRIAVFATHQRSHVDRLLGALRTHL